ncbi:MAG TPA: VOC family protein [candidate division Zixibacteria bacterium]|nr:VOC family protein [candidate division Zixibacteria bacterium]
MAENKYPHGTFCWYEAVSTDVPASTRFYTELLGWQAERKDSETMEYTVFKAGNTVAAGLMAMPPDATAVPSHWMGYIAVDNVDELAERSEKLGGKIIHGPADIPKVGRFLIIQDPTGAVVTLITMVSK